MTDIKPPVRRPLPFPEPVTTNTKDDIEAQLAAARKAVAEHPGIKNIVFAACGGSYALLMPVEHFMSTHTKSLPTSIHSAAEFTSRNSALVGPETLAILCSHSGGTPETVEAAKHARERGALTIAFTNDGESALAGAVDHTITYQHGANRDLAFVGGPLALRLGAAVLDELEGLALADLVDEGVRALPNILEAAEERYRPIADQWAFDHRKEELIYTMAAGSNYGSAYAFAICLLQEMLWIHSAAIHAGEYFHGPFEITDVDVPFIVLKGLDSARGMEQRAADFALSRSDHVLVIDAEDFALDPVDESIRGAFAHLVFAPVLRIFAEEFADHTGHLLSVRRYMWRMEY